MTNRLEDTILTNLIFNEEYTRKVLPFLKDEYFATRSDKIIFSQIYDFVNKYNNLPTKETLTIELNNRKDINEEEFKAIKTTIAGLNPVEADLEWLFDTTEKFCKDKAVNNAVLNGIKILDGKDKKRTPEAIPSILSEALAVSFDNHIGHDYIDDADDRFDWYHRKELRLPFDLQYFNRITKGGVPQKTLNVCLAGTGVGKSLFMCHLAASSLLEGKNVLYITLEMAEERIAERIDANLLDVTTDDLHALPKTMFDDRVKRLKEKSPGKLIIKEYPTASAPVSYTHLRAHET